MTLPAFLVIYWIAVVAASLLGGWIPLLVRLTHRRMQLANSLVAGFMLGVALLTLLPHALMSVSIHAAAMCLIAGLLVMFFLERFFCYHHHDVPQGQAVEAAPNPEHPVHKVLLDHASTGHEHAHHDHAPPHDDQHQLSWSGAATGLVLHSLIDGIALAAAVYAEPGIQESGWLPGIAVFLVVVIHRPLDAMTLLTLTAGTRWSGRARHVLNALFALAVPLGSVIFIVGFTGGSAAQGGLMGLALAFSAGVFLCVALSDLLPELQFHRHDRVKLSVALLLGLALAWTVHVFESSVHDHAPLAAPLDAPLHEHGHAGD